MKRIIIATLLALAVLTTVVGLSTTQAFIDPGACANTGGDICNRQNDAEVAPLIGSIVNILLYVAGVVAIIFMILGGLKLITSTGDSGKVASGRNTILYASIGLIVTVLAYAIVQFAFERIKGV